MIIGVILIPLSIKWPKICRVYLSYQLILYLAHQCLVKDVKREAENYNTIFIIFIYYLGCHFDFWVSFIGTFLTQFGFIVVEIMLYEATIWNASKMFSVNMVMLLANLLVTHAVINSAGLLFSDAEVLREENDQLYNDLEEGLVILDQDTN